MTTEWRIPAQTPSAMSLLVADNSGYAPATILEADKPFDVTVNWNVPPVVAALLTGSNSFRLRLYAESVGPGEEKQIGGTVFEPAVTNNLSYSKVISVPAGTLAGEGSVGGVNVSGIYRIAAVLQLMSGATATEHQGFADVEPRVFLTNP